MLVFTSGSFWNALGFLLAMLIVIATFANEHRKEKESEKQKKARAWANRKYHYDEKGNSYLGGWWENGAYHAASGARYTEDGIRSRDGKYRNSDDSWLWQYASSDAELKKMQNEFYKKKEKEARQERKERRAEKMQALENKLGSKEMPWNSPV